VVIAAGFCYSSFFSLTQLARRQGTRAATELDISLALHIMLLIAMIYLIVRAYRRPTLLLCSIALVLVLGDFALEVWSHGLSNMFAKYWTQMVAATFSLVGICGTLQPQRYTQNGRS
jgi:hypothetical protein